LLGATCMTKATWARRSGGRCATAGAILIAGALLSTAGDARATLATYRSTRELAARSSTIFRGIVLERTSHWQGDLVVTDVLVAVDECWAGRCSEGTVVVRELGGEVDGVGMLSPEPTALPTGEEIVVFARARGAVLVSVGGAQGVFRIEPSSELARRDLSSITDVPVVPEVPMTVHALRREVLRAVARVEDGR
jgi:hypothetical protein